MSEVIKIGILICSRYSSCAGGKCLRALKNREGAFSIYKGKEVELVGYTSCLGCPGGNVENAPQEMKKNGAQVLHLATCFTVGYPPCSSIDYFSDFIKEKFGIDVVVGTHPIPQKYYTTHQKLGTWEDKAWEKRLTLILPEEEARIAYD